MLFHLRFTACCMIILGTSLAWGQSIRIAVNGRDDVTITGTPGDDEIEVVPWPNANLILVRSLNGVPLRSPGGVESSYFGLAEISSSSIRFNMGDGDDVVYMNVNAKSLSANLGKGDDQFELEECIVTDDISVDGGPAAGNDYIDMYEVGSRRNVRVKLGAGDSSDGDEASFQGCTFFGSLTVNQSSGNGYVDVYDCIVGKPTRVSLGSGNDDCNVEENILEALNVNLGAGDKGAAQSLFVDENAINASLICIGGASHDEIDIQGNDLGDVSIRSAAGDDVITFSENELRGNVSLNSSSGNDSLIAESNETLEQGNWNVNTGSGNDIFILNGYLDTRVFSATMGTGDDFVSGFSVDTRLGVPRFNGNGGTDALYLWTDADFRGFETVVVYGDL